MHDVRNAALKWLSSEGDPAPPPPVIAVLTRAGFYHPDRPHRGRRRSWNDLDAALLTIRRERDNRRNWQRRVARWLAFTGERAWTVEILKREAGFARLPWTPAEQVRRLEIKRRKAAIYRRPDHRHTGRVWLD